MLSSACFSQSKELSKTQMYHDFDFLIQKVLQINPSIKIKEQLYKYNITDSIKSFRKNIENCNSFNDFQFITIKVMNTCLDGHSAILTPIHRGNIKLWIPLTYIDGAYYVKRSFSYKNILFPAGARLVSINANKNLNQEIRKDIPYRYMMKWDKKNKNFYSEVFYLSDRHIKSGSIDLSFQYGESIISQKFQMDSEVSFEKPINWKKDIKKVVYFENNKILYIRVPSMNWEDRRFYKSEIIKTAKNKEIDKVIIDVRNNPGGSSLIGRSIIRSIVDKPLNIQYKNYGNNPDFLSKKYKRLHSYSRQINTDTIDFLNNHIMYRYIDRTETLKPYKKSIKHNGEIYILGNEQIYSAAGALFMFANISNTDNIYSIGTSTGCFLGEFSDPVHFQLPNSKLDCMIAPAMDFSNVTDTSTIFLDFYDFELQPTIEDYKLKYEYDGDIYGEYFLLNFDPYFKIIMSKTAANKNQEY